MTEQALPDNLYNKLREDKQKQLDSIATKYSAAARRIRQVLKETPALGFLPYADCVLLKWYLDMDLNELSLYFKPIEKIELIK